jgi:hypothetical protein
VYRARHSKRAAAIAIEVRVAFAVVACGQRS